MIDVNNGYRGYIVRVAKGTHESHQGDGIGTAADTQEPTWRVEVTE